MNSLDIAMATLIVLLLYNYVKSAPYAGVVCKQKGFVRSRKRCYKFVPGERGFAEAKRLCSSLQAKLPSFKTNDKDEQNSLVEFVGNLKNVKESAPGTREIYLGLDYDQLASDYKWSGSKRLLDRDRLDPWVKKTWGEVEDKDGRLTDTVRPGFGVLIVVKFSGNDGKVFPVKMWPGFHWKAVSITLSEDSKRWNKLKMVMENPHSTICEGSARENAMVEDGGWSQWFKWSPCNSVISRYSGIKFRSRTCTKPRPHNGGRKCFGKSSMTEKCDPYAVDRDDDSAEDDDVSLRFHAKSSTVIIVGSVCAIVLAVSVGLAVYLLLRRRAKKSRHRSGRSKLSSDAGSSAGSYASSGHYGDQSSLTGTSTASKSETTNTLGNYQGGSEANSTLVSSSTVK